MKDFLFQYTPISGENLIARPVNDRFVVPIAQMPNRSFIIPNDSDIILLEFDTVRPRAYNRTRARRIGRALCWAGVPVFDERGLMRIYCPRPGAKIIWEAFQFHSGSVSRPAEHLRNYAELGDPGAIFDIVGGIEYALDGNAVVIAGTVLGNTVLVEDERRYYLPEGATLLLP
jgi:hypothetical protein